jgi:hypothetical protein
MNKSMKRFLRSFVPHITRPTWAYCYRIDGIKGVFHILGLRLLGGICNIFDGVFCLLTLGTIRTSLESYVACEALSYGLSLAKRERAAREAERINQQTNLLN